MSYVITIRIPIDAYEKYGIDRDRFLENVKKNAKKSIPEAEVEIRKGIA